MREREGCPKVRMAHLAAFGTQRVVALARAIHENSCRVLPRGDGFPKSETYSSRARNRAFCSSGAVHSRFRLRWVPADSSRTGILTIRQKTRHLIDDAGLLALGNVVEQGQSQESAGDVFGDR